MNINGESKGTGVLNIVAENEGLDSEPHLTINGGTINIQAQNDGINTNEDGVSVTTINGGTLQINAGLGEEGDGIDSNGHLVIKDGNIYTMSNERTPDGGIDADGDIVIHGGYVVALGTRNDAVSNDSAKPYMELSFTSTLPAGTEVELSDPNGTSLLSFTTEKAAQAITFASDDLQEDIAYTLRVNGVVQQYTGNAASGFGPMGGGFRPEGDFRPGEIPEGMELPEGMEPPQRPEGAEGEPPEFPGRPEHDAFTPHEGTERPEGGRGPGMGGQVNQALTGEGSTEFTLTQEIRSFSVISDSAQDSGKTAVTFSAEVAVTKDGIVTFSGIQASENVDPSHVQITVTDVPSEDYSSSCLWSGGDEAIAEILPEDDGSYQLTISVTGDETYTGTNQFYFRIPEVP